MGNGGLTSKLRSQLLGIIGRLEADVAPCRAPVMDALRDMCELSDGGQFGAIAKILNEDTALRTRFARRTADLLLKCEWVYGQRLYGPLYYVLYVLSDLSSLDGDVVHIIADRGTRPLQRIIATFTDRDGSDILHHSMLLLANIAGDSQEIKQHLLDICIVSTIGRVVEKCHRHCVHVEALRAIANLCSVVSRPTQPNAGAICRLLHAFVRSKYRDLQTVACGALVTLCEKAHLTDALRVELTSKPLLLSVLRLIAVPLEESLAPPLPLPQPGLSADDPRSLPWTKCPAVEDADAPYIRPALHFLSQVIAFPTNAAYVALDGSDIVTKLAALLTPDIDRGIQQNRVYWMLNYLACNQQPKTMIDMFDSGIDLLGKLRDIVAGSPSSLSSSSWSSAPVSSASSSCIAMLERREACHALCNIILNGGRERPNELGRLRPVPAISAFFSDYTISTEAGGHPFLATAREALVVIFRPIEARFVADIAASGALAASSTEDYADFVASALLHRHLVALTKGIAAQCANPLSRLHALPREVIEFYVLPYLGSIPPIVRGVELAPWRAAAKWSRTLADNGDDEDDERNQRRIDKRKNQKKD